MKQPENPTGVDLLAMRIRNWGGALLIIFTLFGAIGVATVNWITGDVRAQVKGLRADLMNAAHADSVRFQQTTEIVELAVVALVEPPGSDESRSAIRELRRRRRISY